jgi:hypothetical protein
MTYHNKYVHVHVSLISLIELIEFSLLAYNVHLCCNSMSFKFHDISSYIYLHVHVNVISAYWISLIAYCHLCCDFMYFHFIHAFINLISCHVRFIALRCMSIFTICMSLYFKIMSRYFMVIYMFMLFNVIVFQVHVTSFH